MSIKPYLSEIQIASRVKTLGQELTEQYAGKKPILVGVLKGGVVFMADLARAIDADLELDFLAVSSYGGGTTSSGVVRITHDLTKNIEGRHVLLVEDIVDTGHTLRFLLDHLARRKPASLKMVALLDKPTRREADVAADWIGFEIPDEFVVGYGLDLDGLYRNLPYVGIYEG